MWVSLKENAKCTGNKVQIGRPTERSNKRSKTLLLGKAKFDSKPPALLVHGREIPTRNRHTREATHHSYMVNKCFALILIYMYVFRYHIQISKAFEFSFEH